LKFINKKTKINVQAYEISWVLKRYSFFKNNLGKKNNLDNTLIRIILTFLDEKLTNEILIDKIFDTLCKILCTYYGILKKCKCAS